MANHSRHGKLDATLRLALVMSFIESFATVLVERGVYFYAKEKPLEFTDTQNLWLALGIGVFYIGGAITSHRIALKLGERNTLVALMLGHLASHIALATWSTPTPFLVINFLLAYMTGAKWPIIESYVSAGRSADDTFKSVGQFSIAWALAVPLSIATSGQLIAWNPSSLFVAAGIINVVTLLIIARLPKAPAHVSHDHPHRPPEERLARYRLLQASGRWSMLSSYVLLFIVAPLFPGIFDRLGFSVRSATVLASLIEVVRAGTFVLMYVRPGWWRGRSGVLAVAAVGLAIGFITMIVAPIFASSNRATGVTLVVAGELIFGVTAGVVYYAALYYAMVVANASIESGGAHESLVGAGFAVGPALGLVGQYAGGFVGGATAGTLAASAPMAVIFVVAALVPVMRLRGAVAHKHSADE